ncbi:MAG: leucine-rich repeat domain-containing protein [Pseudomonadota bacterium]
MANEDWDEALRRIEEARESRATELNLSALRINVLQNEITTLSGLQGLDLDGTQVSDLTLIADLSGLQDLELTDTLVSDLTPIANLSRLRRLDLRGTQVTDLSPISNLAELQTLNLMDTQVTDLSPIATLSGLQSLNLIGTQVADLAPIATLSGIHHLFLTRTPVTDLSHIANFSGMQRLELSDTQVSDLHPIATLSRLQRLSLMNTPLTELDPIANLFSMQSLELSGTQVADLNPISALSSLKQLGLSHTQVADLTPMATFSRLERLGLWGTQVANLTPIANLSRLQSLDIRRAQVVDLRPAQSIVERMMERPASALDRGLDFADTPACQDPAIAAAAEIEDQTERHQALLAHLRTLPPWPEPLTPPPEPKGDPHPPVPDPALPIVQTEDGLDLAAAPTESDPVVEASLEDLRRIIDLLARKANQHDDLRGLTDRAKELLQDPSTPPDALRLHLVYQSFRRLHAGRDSRADSFDEETVSALDSLQDCVPGITLSHPQVQILLDRQRQDQAAPSAAIDRARETAFLEKAREEDAPTSPTIKTLAREIKDAPADTPEGATRKTLARNLAIKALGVAVAGSVTVGTWVLSQSLEIQSLAASIGDDAYWWATRMIDKVRAMLEARAPGP